MLKAAPDNDTYVIKSLRADEKCYVHDCFTMLTRSPTQSYKMPLRTGSKKNYTVDGIGIHKRIDKQPQYTTEQKKFFSPIMPASLTTKDFCPKFFGHNKDRRNQLVGIAINLKDVLLSKRLYIYDGGTVGRPYDFDSKEQATNYYQEKVVKNNILFADFELFKQALLDPANRDNYNEVLVRLRWNKDGSSKIIIGSDNYTARAIAQEYARILLVRLRQQAQEQGEPWDNSYEVPICYYLPGDPKHMQPYTKDDQIKDRVEAKVPYNKPIGGKVSYLLLDVDEGLFQHTDAANILLYLLNSGNTLTVQSLLERCSDKNILQKITINNDLSSDLFSLSLINTALTGDIKLAQWLLSLKIPIRDDDLRAAIISACSRNRVDMAELLITKLYENYNYWTSTFGFVYEQKAFLLCVEIGAWEIAKIWVSKWAEENQRLDIVSRSEVFLYAARANRADVVTHLLEVASKHYKFSYFSDGNTSFHWAAHHNNPVMLRRLLALGYKLHHTNDDGKTIMAMAADKKAFEIINIVLEHAPKTDTSDSFQYYCALTLAARENQFELVVRLIKAGALVNFSGADGNTPLHWAVTYHNLQMVKLLMEKCASLASMDTRGRTPVELASAKGYWDIVAHCFSYNFLTGTQDKFHFGSVLLHAAKANQLEIVRLALANDASLSWRTEKNGYDAMHWAVHNDNFAMLELLLQYGSDLKKPNKEGRLPAQHPNFEKMLPIIKERLNQKFNFLVSLESKWVKTTSGLRLFSLGTPDGIKRLRSALVNLPKNIDDGIESWPKIEKIYHDCVKILAEKQKNYEGIGKRYVETEEFYREQFATAQALGNFNPGP